MRRKLILLNLKKIVLPVCFLCLSTFCFAQQDVSFYFQAHQDDWQLFMSANAWDDAGASAKIVFVTLTAGQAEYGAGNVGDQGTGTSPYYLARERGSVQSTVFMSHEFGFNDTLTHSIVTVNGHRIRKVICGNIVNYYLRLSDGGSYGEGYANERYESLKKLHDGTINKMYAIDTSAVYRGWQDLVSTLQSIVTTERNGDPTVFVNCADTNTTINPNDHPDHFYTSLAVQDAVSNLSWVGIAQFIDYYTQDLVSNLSTDQIENASALDASDVLPVINANYASTWEPDHKSWLPADYFRVTRFPVNPYLNSVTQSAFAKTQSNVLNSPVLDNIFPNPINKTQGIHMNIHSVVAGKAIINLITVDGRIISSIEKEVAGGKSTISFPLNQDIDAGNYFIKIIIDNKFTDTKMVVIQ